MGLGKKWFLWSSQVVIGMLLVQAFLTGMQILSRVILGEGTFVFALMTYRYLVAALCVAPLAFYFESAWAIWTERNKITHGQHLGQPQQIVNWIDSYYGTVVSARDGAKVSSLPIQRNRNNSEVLHRDPQEEQRHTILMVDAAVLNNTSSVGLGAIILSEDRRVRAAVCKPLKDDVGSFYILIAKRARSDEVSLFYKRRP
ncbi:hypothetical protein G4B88_029910 [Cannabis sativa]|uniref:Uncharacterized protein n=1 Tax=Cannabis sativa TaxID=3483 RepID=A0A7J6DMW4_CANSA|nr:hypothetical protein G4B88_029910 [Cannabis sativa]